MSQRQFQYTGGFSALNITQTKIKQKLSESGLVLLDTKNNFITRGV